MANLIFLFCINELELTICEHNFKIKIKVKYPLVAAAILLQLCSN